MSAPHPPDAGRVPGVVFTLRMTPDGAFAFHSPDWAEAFLEASPGELSDQATANAMPQLPDDGPELWNSVRRSAADLTPWRRELRMIGPKSGRERWLWVHSVPARDPDGTVVWTGLAVDVTDLRAAQSSLRHADEELAFHVGNTPLAVIEWDRDFRVVRWTGQAEAVFGWAAAEVVRRNPMDWRFVHDDDAAAVAEVMREMVALRRPRNVTVNRNYTKAGAVIWCEWHNSTRLDAAGRMASCLSLVLDVTERRAAEDALARSDGRLRAALASAQMIGWDWDIATSRATYSGDFADFYGLPRGPDYGELASTWAAIHPDDAGVVTAARQAAVDGPGDLVYEFRGRVPDPAGRVRWFATRGQFLRDPDGTPTRVVAVTADISDRKRAEAEQAELTGRLLDAQKWESLGVLAGGVAHDFNNILTVVLGSAGLARKTLPPAAPARPFLDQIETACRRAADLCRQMLAYSGRGPVTAGRTDLNTLIRDSAALLGVPASKNVGLLFELQPDLPAVPADAAQVRQVLVNLVMNAAEALGDTPGEIRVRTCLAEVQGTEPDAGYRLTPSPGRYVCLDVSDTGPGIAPDVRARMFDPFFSTRFAGRGLGLAAVLGFVRSHGGAIRVDTEMGVGTTVSVLWPIEPRASEVTRPPAPPRARPSAGHALVVDDEMYIREVAASTLEELGYEPLLAADGVTGVELYRSQWRTVRVAVIDVVMPKMNGDQVLEALRVMDPTLPAVVISGYTDRRTIRAAAGTRTEFLQKPFLPDELANAVRRVVAAPA